MATILCARGASDGIGGGGATGGDDVDGVLLDKTAATAAPGRRPRRSRPSNPMSSVAPTFARVVPSSGVEDWIAVRVGSAEIQVRRHFDADLLRAVVAALLPFAYLDEVLPYWPRHRYLELAPKHWAATRARLRPEELAAPPRRSRSRPSWRRRRTTPVPPRRSVRRREARAGRLRHLRSVQWLQRDRDIRIRTVLARWEPVADEGRNRHERLAPRLLIKDTMRTRWLVVGWVLVSGLSMVMACSSSQKPGADRDGGGAGGPDGGGGSEEVRFHCDGTLFCSVAREYCRDFGSRGGASGAYDGGTINTQHTFTCVTFGDCAARDCSCVPQGLFGCSACSQLDGGGTLAMCDQILRREISWSLRNRCTQHVARRIAACLTTAGGSTPREVRSVQRLRSNHRARALGKGCCRSSCRRPPPWASP